MLLRSSFTPGVMAALIVAFSSLGDAYLYIALPLNAAELGIPAIWVGVLLSINRFVRLFANQIFVFLFENHGFRRITFISAILSVLTTISYGIAPGIAILLVARMIWGICFAALRLVATTYALQSPKQGVSLGIGKGLQELGAITALTVGPLLLYRSHPQTIFLILAMASIPAIILAYFLPESLVKMTSKDFSLWRISSGINVVSGLSAFLVQGLLIINITRLLSDTSSTAVSVAVIAGLLLAYRRICAVLLSPLAGNFADHWGIDRVHLWSTLLTAFGALSIAAGWSMIGIVMAFTFEGISSAMAPGHSAMGKSNPMHAAAGNSTWSDMGAAFGVLSGGALLTTNAFIPLLFFVAITLLFLCSFYLLRSKVIFQEN